MDAIRQPKEFKVIFLDVDGVLNKAFDVDPMNQIEADKAQFLKQIVDRTGAKIVVSSSWKYHQFMLDILTKELDKFGLEIYDKTPNLNGLKDRHIEILEWLKSHFKDPESECKYVVLDDWDMTKDLGYHMLTTWEPDRKAFGLDQVFVDRACEILQ